jgi:hypothetical protein
MAALVKSGSADYSYVGLGNCKSSQGGLCDHIKSSIYQADNIDAAKDAAIAWCEAATAYASKLVGVEVLKLVDGGYYLYCIYENGIVNNIRLEAYFDSDAGSNNTPTTMELEPSLVLTR